MLCGALEYRGLAENKELPLSFSSHQIESNLISTGIAGGSLRFGGTFTAKGAYHAARARKLQTERRLAWLQGLWDDPACFDAIVASGRYLKLCAMLEWADDTNNAARLRLLDASGQRISPNS
jgi:hypothetical protein